MQDIRTLLDKGRKVGQAAHAAGEADKLGTLRGGNAGALIEGNVYGKCHRMSHLRQQGVDFQAEDDALIMFAAGFGNEDIVKAELEAAGCKVLAEEEVPITIELASGTKVTGRPDLVVCDSAGTHQRGVELKLVSSIYTAKGVHYELVPKREHLIQAALYSYGLGKLPWSLLYVSRNYWHTSMLAKGFKSLLAQRGWDIDFGDRDGQPFRIRPFEREYKLDWTEDGFLRYDTEGLEHPVVTRMKAEHILDYYQAVDEIQQHQDLGPRPVAASIDGTKSYSPCDYCPLKTVCDEHEDNYQQWRDYAEQEARNGNKK